ncbi:MAG: septum formation protein Maf [Prevotella sp.]|nr:septum formation protein Maf [Candidatus Prevotella equi]
MLILASNSPRRKELLKGLGVPFDVLVIKGIDESFPDTLAAENVAEYIAKKKAAPYKEQLLAGNTVITADTVVVCEDEILGKPKDEADAHRMLRKLSGKTHQVYTGVCIVTKDLETSFSVRTDVTFKELTDDEILYYIREYKPFDKAGAYGIQEWIGYIGITNIDGSYYNVMGLPVQRIYEVIKDIM